MFNDYINLNRELVELCNTLYSRLKSRIRGDIVVRISSVLLLKTCRTLKGILLLYDHHLNEQAQSLVRILIELSINFSYFFMMLGKNPQQACQQIIDSSMIEKVKQQRASNFKGLELIPDGPSREDLERTESEIISRYSPGEIKRLRKFGFTMLPLEQTAKITGDVDVYNIVYRNFSRNVHSADFMEHHLLQGDFWEKEKIKDYFDTRDSVSLDITFVFSYRIIDIINKLHKCEIDSNLEDSHIKLMSIREKESDSTL